MAGEIETEDSTKEALAAAISRAGPKCRLTGVLFAFQQDLGLGPVRPRNLEIQVVFADVVKDHRRAGASFLFGINSYRIALRVASIADIRSRL